MAIYGTRDEIWWDIRYTYRKDRLARNNTIPNSSELFTLTSRFCFSLVFSFSWLWLGDPWKMLVSRKVYTPSCRRVFFYNSSWRVSFVIFAPFFFQGTRQWLELRKVGRWSQFQCATCTRDVARKHHSCRKEKQQGDMNSWKCWCVSYDLRLLKFGPTSTVEPWVTRYSVRWQQVSLSLCAVLCCSIRRHLRCASWGPRFQRICWFTKLRWLRKPHAVVKLGPHCRFVGLLNPGNKNCS